MSIDPGRTAYEARYAHTTLGPRGLGGPAWDDLPADARAVWARVEEAVLFAPAHEDTPYDCLALALARAGYDGCEDEDDGFRACNRDLCRCRRMARAILDSYDHKFIMRAFEEDAARARAKPNA